VTALIGLVTLTFDL